ncbi:MAG: septal ring lytic transglycosylase RlpA family protein [Treponema sp.]|jgi:hypothetical protein|nr:septal ring lytic transglycosylase RlpA family protein [Treponema sp.]
MKRSSAVFCFGFLLTSVCFAQIQTGNASFNPSKTGLFISHSSLSFNTRVKVTNLRNNRSVEAVVNGRIPIEGERIADISLEAGTALQMGSGLTPVEIEVLPPHEAAPAAAAPSGGTPAGNAPAGQGSLQPAGTALVPPAPPAAPVQGGDGSSTREQSSQGQAAPQILPIQTVTDVQYVQVPGGNCCNSPLLLVVLALLIVVIILLLVILILILRRLFLWPWHYPVWYRRHLLYAKKHRR